MSITLLALDIFLGLPWMNVTCNLVNQALVIHFARLTGYNWYTL